MTHLETSTIIDFIEERLGASEVSACEAHLKTCSVCEQEYRFWRQMNATLTSERLEDPSEEQTQECISIFPGAPAASGFRRVLGKILFDSVFAPPPALAIRGEGGARQIVAHIEDVDIHLRIAGSGPKQRIQGQILPRGQGTAVNAAPHNRQQATIWDYSTSETSQKRRWLCRSSCGPAVWWAFYRSPNKSLEVAECLYAGCAQ
jgi:hypothetical protein